MRLVVGLGNLLLGDEGVGLHVIQQLSKQSLPRDVQVLDGGTLGPALIGYLEGVEHLFLIDAMVSDGRPGSLYITAAEEINWVAKPLVSMHQLGVFETVSFARKSGFNKPITVVGVEPGNIGYSTNLSTPLKKALPQVVKSLYQMLTDVEVIEVT